jgi:hypothetical protein
MRYHNNSRNFIEISFAVHSLYTTLLFFTDVCNVRTIITAIMYQSAAAQVLAVCGAAAAFARVAPAPFLSQLFKRLLQKLLEATAALQTATAARYACAFWHAQCTKVASIAVHAVRVLVIAESWTGLFRVH